MRKKYTDEQLVNAVKNSNTLQAVLDKLGLIGGHTRIKEKIIELNLDTSQWKNFSGTTKGKRLPIKDLLKNNIYIPTSNLKIRLLNNGYFKYECAICKISEWNKKYVSLQLDHINGDRKDNRIENLRLLCPNCHSQTDTYCGKNSRGKKRKKEDKYIRYPCTKCNKLLRVYTNKLKMCSECKKSEYNGKIDLKQLYKDYDNWNQKIIDLCNKYNISRTTLKNLLKRRAT